MIQPIPMLLTCPACAERHIDTGEFATKHHHTHACQHCGMVWRPAVVNTVGVRFLPGFKDEPETPLLGVRHIILNREKFEAAAEMTGFDIRMLIQNNLVTGSHMDLYEIVPGEPDRLIDNGEIVKIREGQRFFMCPSLSTAG